MPLVVFAAMSAKLLVPVVSILRTAAKQLQAGA